MDKQLEDIIKEVVASMGNIKDRFVETEKFDKGKTDKITRHDYPIANKRPELLNTPTGKKLEEITLQGVIDDRVNVRDVSITYETLELQAQVAESMGRKPFAENLRRAAELIGVPDERILEIYNALRPYRSTKEELLEIADELENKYGAIKNANLVRESAGIYESRGRLKRD